MRSVCIYICLDYRLGQLLVGDRVIAINGQKLLNETLQQAYKLIQEGDDILSIEVEFDVEGTCTCVSLSLLLTVPPSSLLPLLPPFSLSLPSLS